MQSHGDRFDNNQILVSRARYLGMPPSSYITNFYVLLLFNANVKTVYIYQGGRQFVDCSWSSLRVNRLGKFELSDQESYRPWYEWRLSPCPPFCQCWYECWMLTDRLPWGFRQLNSDFICCFPPPPLDILCLSCHICEKMLVYACVQSY